MKFGIASYHRPELPTLNLLVRAGVDLRDIIVSTQTKSDFEKYKKRWPKANIIYAEKDCAAGNRNTILSAVNSPIWLLDDDITSFAVAKKGRYRAGNEETIRFFAAVVAANRKEVVGLSPNANNLTMRNRPRYSWGCVLQGTALYIPDSRIRFNEEYKMVEDYELCLRQLVRGGAHLESIISRLTNQKTGRMKAECTKDIQPVSFLVG